MCMNRFCIDEDAAFEVSEIYFKSKFKRKSEKMKDKIKNFYLRKTKGKKNSRLHDTASVCFDELCLREQFVILLESKIRRRNY